MFYVYVLQSVRTKEFYKGLTDNLERRLIQHFAGRVPSTKTKLPLRLVHVEICKDRQDARKLERFFKSGYGREIIDELVQVAER